MKILAIGDAHIGDKLIEENCRRLLKEYNPQTKTLFFGKENAEDLDKRAFNLEKNGPDAESPPEGTYRCLKDIEALLVHYCPVSSRMIEKAPNLKIVGTCRGGYENIDVDACTRNGIVVFHVVGRTTDAVADFTIGLMLAECRNIARAHFAIKEGKWRKEFQNSEMIPELPGRVVGIIGFGEIGRAVARRLSGFRVKIYVYDPFVPEKEIEKEGAISVNLNELLRSSDFVTLHARLTNENQDLIGKNQLSLMKPTSYLINTAREGLIDEKTLINALKKRQIAGAALDVFSKEPLEPDNPLVKLDNVTLTSHIAYDTKDFLEKSPRMLIQDISRFAKRNNPRFILNPEVITEEHYRIFK
jgi:D-3-phosphoglycerate dehydrogenase